VTVKLVNKSNPDIESVKICKKKSPAIQYLVLLTPSIFRHKRRWTKGVAISGFKFDIHMSVHRNIILNYSQQDATFLEFIYFHKCSTCFRRSLHPSSEAHNCTYSLRYCQPILLPAVTVKEIALSAISSKVAASSSIGWQYLKLYVQLCAPDDGWRNHLKHVERL